MPEKTIEKLKSTNSQLKEIINNSGSGIAIINFNTKFLYLNDSLPPLLGYSKQEVLDNSFNNFIDEESKLEFLKFLKDSTVENQQGDITVKCQKKDKSIVYLKLSLSLMNNKKYFILNTIDITNEVLLTKNSSSDTKLEVMGETITTLSKEWERPLDTISKLSTSLDGDFKENNKIHDLLSKINSCVGELTDSMDEFKSLVSTKEKSQSVEIKNLVSTLIKPYIRQCEFKLICKEDITLHTYENRLVEVFNNIIKNSIEAMRRNSIDNKSRSILIEINNNNTYAILKITDNAGGIDKESINKVFDPDFSSKDSSMNKAGFGLYLSKNIIEMHLKGSIDIISQQNKTSVMIKLPIT